MEVAYPSSCLRDSVERLEGYLLSGDTAAMESGKFYLTNTSPQARQIGHRRFFLFKLCVCDWNEKVLSVRNVLVYSLQ